MKSLFTVHTNGRDEWIKVDKRMYDKAIDMFCAAHEAELKAKDKRIAELEAQIKAIKEYCREQIQAYDGPQTDVEYGLSVGYQNILNKIG